MLHSLSPSGVEPDRENHFGASIIPFLLRTCRDMVFVATPSEYGSGNLMAVNDEACHSLGYSREDLLGLPPQALLSADTLTKLPCYCRELTALRQANFEGELIGAGSKKLTVEIALHLLHYRHKPAILAIVRDTSEKSQLEEAWQRFFADLEQDISKQNEEHLAINRRLQQEAVERANAEQELSAKEQQLRLITDNMLDMILQTDNIGIIRYISPSCHNLLGYPPDAMLGTSIFDYIYEQDVPNIRATFANLITDSAATMTECRFRRYNGRWIWIEGVGKQIVGPGREVRGVVTSLRDITNRKRMEQQLTFQAIRDPITGLHNRTFFEVEMSRLTDVSHHPVGLIICDLDGLKYINDTLGHEMGDALLAKVGSLIRETVSENEIVARIGGDEFAIILPNTTDYLLADARERIRKAISDYNDENPRIPLYISIGSAITGDNLDLGGLFKAADNSMYREKLHSQRSSRSSVVHALKKALEVRDFVTEGHANRLKELCVQLAKLCGFPDYRLTDLRLFAEFHDIGKVGIPDQILFKPGPLLPEEMTIMRGHCEIGHRIAFSTPDLEPIADWILKHHEWWNGMGYPLGLKSTQIPMECRILSIVDAYDAMTNDRPYRKAMSHSQALAEIHRCAGTQFDPEMVERFVDLLESIGRCAE